jgi:ppGpp synthetase/RelA/SpoT-type nucleotidyltranferase
MAGVDLDIGYLPCVAGEYWLGNMVQVKRLYTPGQIDRAGKTLTNPSASKDELTEAFSIVDNWRKAHAYPVELARMALDQRVAEICPDAVNPDRPIVSERLKRIESIREKLIREPKMNLFTMQDIGGCRAILRGPEEVEKLLRSYADVPDLKTTDYIPSPRVSGYRSTHPVWRFR